MFKGNWVLRSVCPHCHYLTSLSPRGPLVCCWCLTGPNIRGKKKENRSLCQFIILTNQSSAWHECMKYLKHKLHVWWFEDQFQFCYWNDLICVSKFKDFCGDCNSERGNFRNVVFRPRKTVSLNLDGSPGNWMIFFLFHQGQGMRESGAEKASRLGYYRACLTTEVGHEIYIP